MSAGVTPSSMTDMMEAQLDEKIRELGTPEFQQDGRLFKRFHLGSVLNVPESKKQGRRVCDEVVFITIMDPGDRDNIISREATAFDKQRFAKEWEAYESGRGDQLNGTPLAMMTEGNPRLMTLGQLEELKYLHVQTVEQLAQMTDQGVAKVSQGISLREKARALVASLKEQAPIEAMRKEREAQDAKIQSLESSLAELKALMANQAAAAASEAKPHKEKRQ